ncbi:hypothetical protein GCM10011492_12760 [Flexivirga endophytica]|uniref:Chromosome partitioning protein ParB n=1 Tax=Flexivirga endophytica TaxID=1849103 RepID=A0A916WQ95_9MICO|nr:hypothetical protein [Flexivirga endophytica]GGB24264.1 hypothetical protein GCM10011492_12760 [Flexivirga endophytica]GHB62950.1 hypothetical protein GCM10008112_34880 [Flexivirga endophytica]
MGLLAHLGRNPRPTLMSFREALDALGDEGVLERRLADVPIAQVVGSAARPRDFDADFRPLSAHLRPRRDRLADHLAGHNEPAPVDLYQLGNLYFVADGHHRISVLKSMGRQVVTARVVRYCTVAFAMACLRAMHLPSKAAERRFLERIPLADPIRTELWLDKPEDWVRLADRAEAWGYRHAMRDGRPLPPAELAARWWRQEVEPTLELVRASGFGAELRDVELYLSAVTMMDRAGRDSWSPALLPTG